jgi:predicted O-methyltransferase YrrM
MAHTARHLVSVDWHRGDRDTDHAGRGFTLPALLGNLQWCNVRDRVTVIVARAQEACPILAPAAFDLCFVDGAHCDEQVDWDTRQALRLVRPGGMIAWHDWAQVHNAAERVLDTRKGQEVTGTSLYLYQTKESDNG